MKYARLWFVALVLVAMMRLEPVCLEEYTDPIYPAVLVMECDFYDYEVPIPPPQPFFSFLDQKTGLWKEEWK